MRERVLYAAALVWGLAEAMLFFLVPDVLLTVIAQRRGFRMAAVAACFAVAGACLGGALMWRLGRDHQDAMVALLDWVPAVSLAMIARAGPAVSEAPLQALIAGAFSGVPYKVFAAVAANAGVSLSGFLLITIPARATRFLLSAAAATLADRIASRWLARRTRTRLLILAWTVFYVLYWLIAPN